MVGMLRGARAQEKPDAAVVALVEIARENQLEREPVRGVGQPDADARLDVPAFPGAIDDAEQLVRLLAAGAGTRCTVPKSAYSSAASAHPDGKL